MYTHFDYLKVVAILKELRNTTETRGFDSCLNIYTFDGSPDIHECNDPDLCFDIDFFPFRDKPESSFLLVNSFYYADRTGNVLFSFEMEEESCRIIQHDCDERERNFVKTILSFPVETKENTDWRTTLKEFIKIVTTLSEYKIE